MDKLVNQSLRGQVDELKRRILAQARVISWMEQVVNVYDNGTQAPSNERLYRTIAGAAVSYFRGVAYHGSSNDDVDWSVRHLLQDLWYETVAGEVRCIQGFNSQVGRRDILQRTVERAREAMRRDFVRLACRIGHGPEMEEFEDEVVSASNEVLVNVQMLYRSLLGRNPSSKQRASQASLRLIVGGRKELDADQTQLYQLG